ncbi:MAG: GNAT family N-acetyltransferase [Candidatus Hodarchaeota archaeon]
MLNNVIIRKYKPEDAQQCSSLMQDHFRNDAINLPELVRKSIADARTAEYVISISKDRTLAVAELNNKIIGMGGLKGNEVRHIYVNRKFHKKKIGSAILNFLGEEAMKKGLFSIIVNSVFYAMDFYLKNGFTYLQHTQIERHGSVIEAILLEKQLK